jgi:oligopeptide/dipeptide ABC transporter ATP-binding protein
MALLDVRNLRSYFFTERGVVRAVDGVSFVVAEGETMGLVGESGSGKSVTGYSILGVLPKPTGRTVAGEILFRGEDLLKKSPREMREVRGRDISMILQDPFLSLNPVLTVGRQVAEAIRLHSSTRGKALVERVKDILHALGIAAPARCLTAYPHELSGGMRQRVVGAIALACQPRLIIADEPTTALDATVQAQYLALLRDIQQRSGLSMLFITHDFGVVAAMCHQVAVMYAGRIIEVAAVREIFDRPAHPYTEGLLRAVPSMEARPDRLYAIPGKPMRQVTDRTGCTFAPRCDHADDRCWSAYPPVVEVAGGHEASCWSARERYARTTA